MRQACRLQRMRIGTTLMLRRCGFESHLRPSGRSGGTGRRDGRPGAPGGHVSSILSLQSVWLPQENRNEH